MSRIDQGRVDYIDTRIAYYVKQMEIAQRMEKEWRDKRDEIYEG